MHDLAKSLRRSDLRPSTVYIMISHYLLDTYDYITARSIRSFQVDRHQNIIIQNQVIWYWHCALLHNNFFKPTLPDVVTHSRKQLLRSAQFSPIFRESASLRYIVLMHRSVCTTHTQLVWLVRKAQDDKPRKTI